MTRQTYTDDEKSEALSLYMDVGVAESARRTGINPLTISSWARRAGLHTNAPVKTKEATEALRARAGEMREELRLRMLHKALDLLDRMDAPHVEFKGKDASAVTYPIAPAGAVQNYATSAAILLDKYRLEVGEATNRTENLSITDGINDHERQALRDAIVGELARRADEGAPVPTVGTAGPEGADTPTG
jgi:hypothetical protein